jgi:hypothetical protein
MIITYYLSLINFAHDHYLSLITYPEQAAIPPPHLDHGASCEDSRLAYAAL